MKQKKTQIYTSNKSLAEKLLRLGWRFSLALIPENRFGDKVISFINFIRRHRRLPTKELIFNDVLYQIKTTDEILNPLRVFVSDKEFLKLYVRAIVGEKYNVPTIAILQKKEQVDSYCFPDACVIKPTQASGKVIVRKNNEDIDYNEIKSWFSINHYLTAREANYKTLRPKIIVEPIIFNDSNLNDYKFFCYDGKPRFVKVDYDRFDGHKRKFFDCNWNELDFSFQGLKSEKKINKPDNFNEMLEVATALCKNFSMIRVDLYTNGTQVYVGELTNLNGSGGSRFDSPNSEIKASNLLFKNYDRSSNQL